MEEPEVRFEPDPERWGALLADARGDAKTQASFLGRSAATWRDVTRRELNVPTDAPVIATGHEAVLWHPGILAKYIALHAWAEHCGAACVHLVVDQHVGGFDSIDVPVRRNGGLDVATVSLGPARPDVPMGWHPPFDPPKLKQDVEPALLSVRDGLNRILELVRTHRDAPNAAAQMGRVLDELLRPWFRSISGVTASALMRTSLARAMVQAMIDDPRGAVEQYNNAVARVTEAGIGGLATPGVSETSGGEIELPLWRIDSDGRRQRAFDRDARAWIDDPSRFSLLPRALTMTALLRLGACDVFIHGFGGARYDPAMEQWIESWLGVTPQPTAMVSATLRLPLADPAEGPLDARAERHRFRRAWHDPPGAEHDRSPSRVKTEWLRRIEQAPRGSIERRNIFFDMHEKLAQLREQHQDAVDAARDRLERARKQQRERDIVERRTWPFPFYPADMVEQLAMAIVKRVRTGCGATSPAVTSARSPAP